MFKKNLKGGNGMSNTIDSYCSSCQQSTYFVFTGEGWECGSCGAMDTNKSDSTSNPYYNEWNDED